MQLSSRASSLTPSLTLSIDSKAKAMKSEGIDVCGFGAGEPDFDTPEHIKAAAMAALEAGFTKYTPSSGIPELRQAIADKFLIDNGIDYKPSQIIVSDGRGAHLYVFVDCRLQTAADNQGAPFVFDLQNLRDNGTGIGCSDLGPPSAGRHLVGLRALNNDGQWTVRRTEIDINGTLATIGQSDTVTATSAQDPAVVSAQTISCGDLTISKDGVQQP